MRRVMAAIRKMLAALAMPVLMLVDGAWRLLRALGPQASTALEDEADEALEDGPVHRPHDGMALEAAKAAALTTEESRVRLAAQCMMRREPVSSDHLDPSLDRDRMLLSWLKRLDPFELAMVVGLSPDRLRQHLDGRMGVQLPPAREIAPAAHDVDDVVEPVSAFRRAA